MSVESSIAGVVLFAVVFAFFLRGWATRESAAMQRRLLPDVEPWSEEKRRRYNHGVVLRALLFASLFTFVAWAVASKVLDVM